MANPDDSGPVDPWSHFVNVLMLDRHGNRINRRNPQDIFTPLYDKQIPPGAAAVVHYRIDVPPTAAGPVELTTRLRYRKFDYEYMKLVHNGQEPPRLPIVDLCEDRVILPVEGGPAVPPQSSPIAAAWQRWNDYGIGCLLEGGGKRGHFRQAEAAFGTLLLVGSGDAPAHGHLNLARVYVEEGRMDEAARELHAAGRCDPPAPAWSRLWFTALVNSETATRKEHFDAVIADLERLLDPNAQPRDRGFDFTKDYVVWNRLANRLFKRGQFEEDGSDAQREFLLRAVKAGWRVIELDAEDVEAHDLLSRAYARLAADVPPGAEPASAEELLAAAAVVADEKKAGEHADRARYLASAVPNLKGPRLPAVRELIAKLGPAFQAARDPQVRGLLAAALAALHRESHALYKPDEIARSNAARVYREAHPQANYAARERVIYPTTPAHRDAILKTGNLP